MKTLALPLMKDGIADLRNYSLNPKQRIPWGIPSLDYITEGPAAGEVFTVIGRSYTGKSLIATNIMVNNPDNGIIFFSLEMPARQAISRLYASWAEVSHTEVQKQTRAGSLPKHLDLMGEALDKHIIFDEPGLSLGDMEVVINGYEDYFDERPKAVIIDYLELIAGGKSGAEGWIRTEATASSLKDWAKKQQIPVFLLHQTTKEEPPWKPPTPDSARGAGFTESDVVVGLWRPGTNPNLGAYEQKNLEREVLMNVLKNRVTGRSTSEPIRCFLRDDLRIVDMKSKELAYG